MEGNRFDVVRSSIAIWNQCPPGGHGMALNNGMAMLAIYATVVAMTEERFNPTSAHVSMHGRPIGFIAILKKSAMSNDIQANNGTGRDKQSIDPSSSPTSSNHTSPNNNSTAKPVKETNNNTPDSDSGHYTDPEHPENRITYHFTGPRIQSKEIYTSIMEALMILAYNPNTDNFDYLTATSASGNTALHINRADGTETLPLGA
ncbi:MAG: hypothetical protein Q9223_005931, partial [Gallowayella weberi]